MLQSPKFMLLECACGRMYRLKAASAPPAKCFYCGGKLRQAGAPATVAPAPPAPSAPDPHLRDLEERVKELEAALQEKAELLLEATTKSDTLMRIFSKARAESSAEKEKLTKDLSAARTERSEADERIRNLVGQLKESRAAADRLKAELLEARSGAERDSVTITSAHDDHEIELAENVKLIAELRATIVRLESEASERSESHSKAAEAAARSLREKEDRIKSLEEAAAPLKRDPAVGSEATPVPVPAAPAEGPGPESSASEPVSADEAAAAEDPTPVPESNENENEEEIDEATPVDGNTPVEEPAPAAAPEPAPEPSPAAESTSPEASSEEASSESPDAPRKKGFFSKFFKRK